MTSTFPSCNMLWMISTFLAFKLSSAAKDTFLSYQNITYTLCLQSKETVPLFFKALKMDIDPGIPQFLYSVQEDSEMMEKDEVSTLNL